MATPSLAASHAALFSSDDGNFIVFGGIGLANIEAQEFVDRGAEECTDSGCERKGHKCSQLNWESKGITLFTVGADAQIDDDWSLKGSVNFGTGGTGHMVDCDWLSGGHDEWSHRSIHPDIQLDHYVAGAIELDGIIYGDDSSSIAVGAVSAIPTSSGLRMADRAAIRARVASETTTGRLQTAKESSATGKRFRLASSARAANTVRRSYDQRRHSGRLEIRHRGHRRPLVEQ
ncbi:omptin family outer membrane protease (plasmid) [Sinorhizobium numidicum]|uniref:Omptin family outer membrane protease n=1 Tax=Sinorhizobium numidicum TaxID=680248 RepID=A0ABY8D9M5_9HYPH|nr:omptin family outer membrane protease [Sinorhizobium numidicum]WEX85708.1 omptin family outer membrane protease [Sinorhizobium numidicum]